MFSDDQSSAQKRASLTLTRRVFRLRSVPVLVALKKEGGGTYQVSVNEYIPAEVGGCTVLE